MARNPHKKAAPGWKTSERTTSVWSRKWCVQYPRSMSHTRTVRSADPVATSVPVGSYTMHWTGIVWPRMARKHSFPPAAAAVAEAAARRQCRSKTFCVATTTSVPLGCKQKDVTTSPPPSSFPPAVPGSVSWFVRSPVVTSTTLRSSS